MKQQINLHSQKTSEMANSANSVHISKSSLHIIPRKQPLCWKLRPHASSCFLSNRKEKLVSYTFIGFQQAFPFTRLSRIALLQCKLLGREFSITMDGLAHFLNRWFLTQHGCCPVEVGGEHGKSGCVFFWSSWSKGLVSSAFFSAEFTFLKQW